MSEDKPQGLEAWLPVAGTISRTFGQPTGMRKLVAECTQLALDPMTPERAQRVLSAVYGPPPAPPDPLDVKIDGVTLRMLLYRDSVRRRKEFIDTEYEHDPGLRQLTPAQRAAVSAHWSAQLRAKVAASDVAEAERERNRVVVDMEDW